MGPVYSGKCRSPNVPVAEQSAFATELAAGRLGFRNKRRVLVACPYIGAREEAGVETDVVLSFRECLFGPRCEKPVSVTAICWWWTEPHRRPPAAWW